MTREQCVFLAKKLFTELVFNTAYIEGVNVTFPQTQAILDGGIVNNVPVSDIQTVLNLRDAWQYCLETLDTPVTLEYICAVNERVSRNESLAWGQLRTGKVGISGTDYEPPIPEPDSVKLKLASILNYSNPTKRAEDYFCYATRSQLFWDGNKRTSTIVASKILIEAGAGVLTIGKADSADFNEALLHYYDTADPQPLKRCLNHCIKTLDPISQIRSDAEREAAELLAQEPETPMLGHHR